MGKSARTFATSSFAISGAAVAVIVASSSARFVRDPLQADLDLAVLYPALVGADRAHGGQRPRLSRPQIEARAVQDALHFTFVQLSLGERELLVRALVV
jgi:hypothetical protein